MTDITIYKPEDCKSEMLYYLKNGKVKGTTTYNEQIDKCWTWREKEANIWSGYSNEGKSLFIKQLCGIKALEENKKFIFCSPEDFPADEFFDDLIHTIAGQTTDNMYPSVISEKRYLEVLNLIKDLFIFLYIKPPNNTIERVLNEFKKICDKQEIFGCVVDPLLKFSRPKDSPDRDDLYASYIGSIFMDFCRQTSTSAHLIMHQLTPTIDPLTSYYPEPSMYRIKGGGSWSDGFDNILSVWRPKYAKDKFDTEVRFSSQKIKKQKLVGIPQQIPMRFDRKTNRYVDFTYPEISMFNFDKFLK